MADFWYDVVRPVWHEIVGLILTPFEKAELVKGFPHPPLNVEHDTGTYLLPLLDAGSAGGERLISVLEKSNTQPNREVARYLSDQWKFHLGKSTGEASAKKKGE